MTIETMEIRQLARQFAESEVRPHVERWDRERSLDPMVFAQLAELGFFGMLVPESRGGMEFDLPAYAAVLEELAWGEPGLALSIAMTSLVAQLIVQYGSDRQQQDWLEQIASGEAVACLGLAEDTGADAADINTTAVRTAEGWVLDGIKKWVANGSVANLALIVARTDTGPAGFLMSTAVPGYSAFGRENTLGFRPLDIVTVELKRVALDADALLAGSEPARFFTSATAQIGIAAIALGISQAALDHARGYADVREQFGQKLRSFEGMQFKLADMALRTEAARSLTGKAAEHATPGLAAMAKIVASEAAMWVSTQAVQVYGGYGYMRDYPVEKLMRDAKATEMLAGSNEELRALIARELYD